MYMRHSGGVGMYAEPNAIIAVRKSWHVVSLAVWFSEVLRSH